LDDDPSQQDPKRDPEKLTAGAVMDFLTTINDSSSMDALKKAFSVAYKAAEHIGDAAAQATFEQAKDKRKTQLQNEIDAQA
ncbi:MAG: hypothetical protein PHE55_22105, partial [Methylococcaceae bacterium]|nr:hypothetical protein [Methylococcaceae bacterium]